MIFWAILESCMLNTQKIGLYQLIRGIKGLQISKGLFVLRKGKNGKLTRSEEQCNCLISSDQIVAKTFFENLCGLWNFQEEKWKQAEKNYDFCLKTGVAIKNSHIRWNPVRAEDRTFYQKMRNHIQEIGVIRAVKCRFSKQFYPKCHRARIDIQLRVVNTNRNVFG